MLANKNKKHIESLLRSRKLITVICDSPNCTNELLISNLGRKKGHTKCYECIRKEIHTNMKIKENEREELEEALGYY